MRLGVLIFVIGLQPAIFAQVPSVQAWEQVISEDPRSMCNAAREWNAGTGQSYNDYLVGYINRLLQQGNTTLANAAIAEGRLYRRLCRGVF